MMNLTKPDEKIAILTCMDMRLDPKKFPGLEQSKAYVILNAGGRANEETIRSLVVAHKFQGAKAIFVIQHTDCGMMNFTNDEMTYEFAVEGFEGNLSSYQIFEIKDSSEEQFYRLYPIANGDGTIFTALNLNEPYDVDHVNLDNLLVTLTIVK